MQQIFNRKSLKLHRDRISHHLTHENFLLKHFSELIIEKLDIMQKPQFKTILDLGSRSPILTKYLQQRYEAQITQTDLSAKILENSTANSKIQCDEEELPFKNEKFDLIISLLNLHNINDLEPVLKNIHNLLSDDGIFIASFFGGKTLSELRKSILLADAALDGASPRISPFVDVKTAASLLAHTGFAMPVTNSDKLRIEYQDPNTLYRDIKNIGESNILLNSSKYLLSRRRFAKISEIYLSEFSNNANEIIATFEIINLTAFKK